MDSLSGMSVFVAVTETRSFATAAERLGVSASAVGKSIARLEDRLNVRLLTRTTRRMDLTDAGAIFLEHSRRILAEVAAVELELRRSTPRNGTVPLPAPEE